MIETLLFWLNSFALFYMLLTSVVFLRNRFELTNLIYQKPDSSFTKKISVCIPARNEEAVIGKLLESVCTQKHGNFEILVLDDNSEDRTAEIIKRYSEKFPGLVRKIDGAPKPEDWLGKPWACNQLGKTATGNIILFLDADTELYDQFLEKLEATFKKYNLDMLTVWPEQIMRGFWQQSAMPLVYYALLTLLPSIYVYRKPRWMPSFVYKRFSDTFAAACGQCVAFTKQAYSEISGHESVKSEIVEDVELAREIKNKGLILRMFSGVGSIRCDMYQSSKEMFQGFRKNFLAGFNYSIPKFLSAALIHIIVFIIPFYSIIHAWIFRYAEIFFMAAGVISLVLLHRLILAVWFRWNPIYAFTHPIGVLWFQWLGMVKIYDYLTGNKVLWKGRKVS